MTTSGRDDDELREKAERIRQRTNNADDATANDFHAAVVATVAIDLLNDRLFPVASRGQAKVLLRLLDRCDAIETALREAKAHVDECFHCQQRGVCDDLEALLSTEPPIPTEGTR